MTIGNSVHPVKAFPLSQKNSATFRDLYMSNTMLVLVLSGSKRVLLKQGNILDALPDELLVFPSSSFISIENRVTSGSDYKAWCLCYSDEIINNVFQSPSPAEKSLSPIHITPCPNSLLSLLRSFGEPENYRDYPVEVLHRRLTEPLLWLKSLGHDLATPSKQNLDRRVRNLIASDPAHKWRSSSVASALGYIESTMRRKLTKYSLTFSEILMSCRLEHALTLLQSTQLSISEIALDCGFSTPSHFSDTFKQRFSVQPKHIRST